MPINILNNSGQALEPGSLVRKYNGMLGISIMNHAFSKQLVQDIARLGVDTCKEFVVVLVDYPYRWNWPLRATDETGSVEWCLRVGREKEAGYVRALRGLALSHSVEIWHWKKIARTPIYKRNLNLIELQFQQNSQFRNLIREQVRSNLGGRIAEAEQKHGLVITTDKIDIMAHYLMEEIAGLWYLQFDLGYSLDFYPGKQMQVMSHIYANDFPEFAKRLGYNWHAQGFIEVGYPPFTLLSDLPSSSNSRTS
jgi:tRNA-dependent cyclodipeptide synthase